MNVKGNIPVNHLVLVWARESLALTRNQASDRTGITSKRIIQLEEGEKSPTLDELKLFSKAYKQTIATLLLSSPPKEKPLPTDRRTVDSTDIGFFDEKTILSVRKARALVKSYVELSQEMGRGIPKFSLSATLFDSPQEFANKVRYLLNLDEIRGITDMNQALDAYIEKVEALGIAIFQLSLTKDNLRGFTIIDEEIPIIGIRRGSEQATAKIFTLFHEFGHILLNESGMCDLNERTNSEVEQWCNAFSGEVLIPTAELLGMQKVHDHQRKGEQTWKLSELVSLGTYFHVGPLALLRSLLKVGLTTSSFYKEKHEKWNKPQFGRAAIPEGRNLPKETIKEKGRTYISLAFSAYDQNKIDIKDLSDFLGVKFSYIQRTRQLLNAL